MPRRGSMLTETIVAVSLIGIAVVGVARLQGVVVRQQRELYQRRLAHEEAANQLEMLLALPWSQLQPEVVRARRLGETAEQRLSSGALRCELEPAADGPPAMRLTTEVSWTNVAGDRERIRLSAWSFAPEGTP